MLENNLTAQNNSIMNQGRELKVIGEVAQFGANILGTDNHNTLKNLIQQKASTFIANLQQQNNCNNEHN